MVPASARMGLTVMNGTASDVLGTKTVFPWASVCMSPRPSRCISASTCWMSAP